MPKMKIAVLKESKPFEERVSCTPETSKKILNLGLDLNIENSAGLSCSFLDEEYKKAGANIVKSQKALLKDADIILSVRRPDFNLLKQTKKNCVLICQMEPNIDESEIKKIAKLNISCFALEFIPRITRAQSMDVLSSQSNLSGYRAVIEASQTYGRALPMMMTAAGTVPPAKTLVMGAGVAGLQAIATAKRLGSIVFATDVRPAAKEQVESLGGKFLAVEDEEFREAESSGGYAKQMSAGYLKKQAALVSETIKNQDIVITTALIPGKPAPKLVSSKMVESMKSGSVIVDLAAVSGGNCELTVKDKIVDKNGVKIIGYSNFPSRLASDSSRLYSRNIFSFLENLFDKENSKVNFNLDDEIIKDTLLTHNGKVLR